MKITPAKFALTALLGLGGLAFTMSGASAAIVCNHEGECWHVKDKYDYPAGIQLQVHNDDWKWGTSDKYKWHEHDGRGYWKGGIWITL